MDPDNENEDVERRDLLNELTRELKEYGKRCRVTLTRVRWLTLPRVDKMLFRERATMAMPKPSERNHRSVLSYLWEEKFMVEEEGDYINLVDDLVILTCNQDSLFEAKLEEYISCIPFQCIRVSLSAKVAICGLVDIERTSLRQKPCAKGQTTKRSICTQKIVSLLLLCQFLPLSPSDCFCYLFGSSLTHRRQIR